METQICEIIEQAGKMVALCPVEHETLWGLLTDPKHWALELVIMVVFDGLVGMMMWPIAKRWWGKHHSHAKCDPQPGFEVIP
jgi:hypothetical protein